MSKQEALHLGPFELYPIEAGRFKLDGGAMFGVVPKTLWSKKIPADEKNRIQMGMRSLLIKSNHTNKIYLIDNGCGDKFDQKMEKIYGIDYSKGDLSSSLAKQGFKPDDITDIIFTHLHFDHCGGTTTFDSKGNLKEVFPNAAYHVNRRHWETATHPNRREKASFFDENLQPIKNSGRLNLVDDFHTFEDGLDSIPMNGHTIGQQLPVIHHDEVTIVYAADLIPSYAHIPLPYVMGYDMSAITTLEEKQDFLEQAVDGGWYLFLEHDAEHEVVSVVKEKGRFGMGRSLKLNEIS
jgi:glyoxylase-like metal-dependent hydrolase (beta-lactamase superfamily II)